MTDSEGPQRLLALLGLARRAGKLHLGFKAVQSAVQRGRRPLVVVARDVGPAQRRQLMRLSPVRGFLTDVVDRDKLAQALGRKELAVVAVCDPGFLAGIANLGFDLAQPDSQGPRGGRAQ